MRRRDKIVLARSMANVFSKEELQEKLKALLSSDGQRVTAWSDIGLSSSVSYEFSIADAVDIINAALLLLNGGKIAPSRIRRINI